MRQARRFELFIQGPFAAREVRRPKASRSHGNRPRLWLYLVSVAEADANEPIDRKQSVISEGVSKLHAISPFGVIPFFHSARSRIEKGMAEVRHAPKIQIGSLKEEFRGELQLTRPIQQAVGSRLHSKGPGMR